MVLVCLLAIPSGVVEAAGFVRQRKIKEFDFDERDEGNWEQLPMDWYAIGRDSLSSDPNFTLMPLHRDLTERRGFPAYNNVRFDTEHRTSGQESLHLELNGGNVGAFVEVGSIPAIPNSDYLVTVRACTTPLEFARVRFTAYFVDNQGQRIEGSVQRCALPGTDGLWTTLSLKLFGEFAQSAYIGMQLEVLQPTAEPDSPLGEHQMVYQQVHGSAWFDDVMVWQLPYVSVTSPSPVNVIRAPQRPVLKVVVRDLTARPLVADMVVYDLARRPVAADRRRTGLEAPTQWQWPVPLESYGWYLVDLNLYEASDVADLGTHGPVARSISALLWLGADEPMEASEAERFGILTGGLGAGEEKLLAELLERTQLGSVTIGAWQLQTARGSLDQAQSSLERLIEPMLTAGVQVGLSLSPLPASVARVLDIDKDSPLSMFELPRKVWRPILAPVLLRHGQRVNRWQVGSPDTPTAFLTPDLATRLDAARAELEQLAPNPHLIVPWRLDQSRDMGLADDIEFLVDAPYAISAENLAEHLEQWAASPPVPVTLHLREPGADELSQCQRAEDLVLRMLHGWEAGVSGLAVSQPWTRSDERSMTILPDPLLGVFAGMAHRLAGRRVMGRLYLAEGVECMILDGPAGGMLVAWNRVAPTDQAVVDMYLGPQPQAVDVWGNRTDVPVSENRHQWQLEDMPIFLDKIDPELARFRAAFKLDEPFIESLQMPHERTVTLTNYWPRTISGHMYVIGPESWRIQPRRRFFSIASGQSAQVPLKLVFPVSEIAGSKRLVARFDFTAEQHYQVTLSAPMELGLKDVAFDAGITAEPGLEAGTTDLVVTELITNHSAKALSVHAFANLPGYPRQERSVPALQPGQSVVQRFRFTGSTAEDARKMIRVGLRQTHGAAVINKIVTLNEADGP